MFEAEVGEVSAWVFNSKVRVLFLYHVHYVWKNLNFLLFDAYGCRTASLLEPHLDKRQTESMEMGRNRFGQTIYKHPKAKQSRVIIYVMYTLHIYVDVYRRLSAWHWIIKTSLGACAPWFENQIQSIYSQ